MTTYTKYLEVSITHLYQKISKRFNNFYDNHPEVPFVAILKNEKDLYDIKFGIVDDEFTTPLTMTDFEYEHVQELKVNLARDPKLFKNYIMSFMNYMNTEKNTGIDTLYSESMCRKIVRSLDFHQIINLNTAEVEDLQGSVKMILIGNLVVDPIKDGLSLYGNIVKDIVKELYPDITEEKDIMYLVGQYAIYIREQNKYLN